MWPDSSFAPPRGSFQTPVLQPSSKPTDEPTKTISINCQWLPYIRGALMQLVLQATWVPTDAGVTDVQMRAMTLISMFTECGESVLPIACPYDFFSAGSELGWSPFPGSDFCHPCYGVWTGTSFESCLTCSGYNQGQMVSPTLLARCDSIEIDYTSAQNVVFDVYNWDGTTATLISAAGGPSGTGVHITIPVGVMLNKLRLVFTNDPADSSHDALIQITNVGLVIENMTGDCP